VTNQDLKKLPIQFTKIKAGVYASADGLWHIHRTVVTGLYGGPRWNITDTRTGRTPYRGGKGSTGVNALTLTDAIETLHRIIGRWLVDAFRVFRAWRREQEQQVQEQQKHRAQIAELSAKVLAFVEAHGPITDAEKAAELAAYLHGGGAQ
jgi:hypothetical protein